MMVKEIEKKTYDIIRRHMPVICLDIVLIKKSRILLLMRENYPAKNQWWFPGGRIYKGETIEQAATRIALNEVALEAKFIDVSGFEETYFEKQGEMQFDIHTINLTADMELLEDKEPFLDGNHSSYMWASHNDINFHDAVRNILAKKGFGYA